MYSIARFFSHLLSPIFVPTYSVIVALWYTVLFFLPASTRWTVVGVTAIITCVIPCAIIFALYRLGKVSDPGLNNRNERYVPYVVTALCYLACGFYMWRIHAPLWLDMFFVGGAAAAVVSCIVNIWWKISAHAAAMGGLTALTIRIMLDHLNVFDIMPMIYIAILLTGILGTSRIMLGRHTFWQVMAGTANGLACVLLFTMIH